MPMTPTGIARTAGLWTLIIGTSISAIIDLFIGNTIWAGLKGLAAIGVICYEIYYYLKHRMTISTKYKVVIMRHEFWGRMSIGFLGLALIGFFIHIWFW